MDKPLEHGISELKRQTRPPMAAPIYVRRRPEATTSPLFQHRLAGRLLLSDEPIRILGPGDSPDPKHSASCLALQEPALEADPSALEVFRGEAFIGGANRLALCSFLGDTGWIEIGGIGEFQVTPKGVTLLRLETRDQEALEYALLGPLLLLVLAMRGVFCLHSSAVIQRSGAGGGQGLDLFLGISGAGKSTLAAQLHELGWRQAADDLVPLAGDGQRLLALPDFPQPKSPDRTFREPLPVRSIHILREDGSLSLARLSGLEATVALVRHTAGALFFPPELLERHMATMTRWARSAPVFHLAYPRRMDVFPEVANLLSAAGSGYRPKPGAPQ